jgi:hypothetical protein
MASSWLDPCRFSVAVHTLGPFKTRGFAANNNGKTLVLRLSNILKPLFYPVPTYERVRFSQYDRPARGRSRSVIPTAEAQAGGTTAIALGIDDLGG